jgi:hypothetical protein
MRGTAFTRALAAGLVIVVGACDESDTVTDVRSEAPGPDVPDASDVLQVEPVLEVEHGVYTLTFLEDDDGTAVVEYAPVDAPPLLDVLVAENATALEILHAVSPGVTAPAALVRAHQESGRTPTATEVPVRDLAPLIEPAAFTGAVTHDTNKSYYGTDCSYSSDLAYFKEIRQSLGWNWHWYKHWKANGASSYYSARTPPTKNVRVHTCNAAPDNPGNRYYWGVHRRPSDGCDRDNSVPYSRYIYPGHRAVFHRTGASNKCRYDSWVARDANQPMVKHGLGIMKP